MKQSYTSGVGGTSAPILPPETIYWAEPLPDVYQDLSDLAKMTRAGLTDMGLFGGELNTPFSRLVDLLDALTSIALNELDGKELTSQEIHTIKYIGDTMSAIINELALVTGEKAERPSGGYEIRERLEIEGDPYKTTVVADVHTDGNTNRVLEVGSGFIDWTVVVRRIDEGVLGAAIGPIFTYYEFDWPMTDRLNDDEWNTLLSGSTPFARPPFTSSYYAE